MVANQNPSAKRTLPKFSVARIVRYKLFEHLDGQLCFVLETLAVETLADGHTTFCRVLLESGLEASIPAGNLVETNFAWKVGDRCRLVVPEPYAKPRENGTAHELVSGVVYELAGQGQVWVKTVFGIFEVPAKSLLPDRSSQAPRTELKHLAPQSLSENQAIAQARKTLAELIKQEQELTNALNNTAREVVATQERLLALQNEERAYRRLCGLYRQLRDSLAELLQQHERDATEVP